MKRLILPGDNRKPSSDEDTPTIVLQEGIREITATTLADEHQGVKALQAELSNRDDAEDWGDGFTVFPEPAHIIRGPDGGIVSVVPLSEIPGVDFTARAGTVPDAPPVEADPKPNLVPLPRNQREKLVEILATRLFKYYQQLPRDYPNYHPFRDGLPDLPAGSPKNLAPDMDKLYPATDGQIYEWMKGFVAARVKIVNKKRGLDGYSGDIRDLALRIE